MFPAETVSDTEVYLPPFFFFLVCFLLLTRASLIAQLVKNPLAMQETLVQFLGWKDLLERR